MGVRQVWTPLQFARALVQSFPWTPDPLSIANCVAEAAREPSAAELLSGRSGSLGSISSGGIQSTPSAGDYSRLVGWNANIPSSNAHVAAAPGRPSGGVASQNNGSGGAGRAQSSSFMQQ